MASVRVHVDGLQELGKRLAKLKTDVAVKAAKSATGAGAQIVKKSAVRHVTSNESANSSAVDTGSLRDAIIVKQVPKRQTTLTSEHIVTVRGRGKKSKKTGIKQKDAPHAHFVEFGTMDMPAEPFLRPAYEDSKEKAVQAIKDRLERMIIKGEKA